jgi:hypothetical protein
VTLHTLRWLGRTGCVLRYSKCPCHHGSKGDGSQATSLPFSTRALIGIPSGCNQLRATEAIENNPFGVGFSLSGG